MNQNVVRVAIQTFFALSLVLTVGCGKRVPTTLPSEKPKEEKPANPPATEPLPPGAPPPAPPAPAPSTPADPPPPPPGPGPNPPAPPPSTAPTAAPTAAPPAPPAANPDVEKFLGEMGKIGFSDKAFVVAEVKKTLGLKVTGWSKGAFDTPEKNIEAKFNATKAAFTKPPADPKEYFDRSMAYAAKAAGKFALFVDMKASQEGKEIIILRADADTKEVMGAHEKEQKYEMTDMEAMRRRIRTYNEGAATPGLLFFYTEDKGFLKAPRFLQIPTAAYAPAAEMAAARARQLNNQARPMLPVYAPRGF